MKSLNKVHGKAICRMITWMALVIAKLTVNSTCGLWIYEDEGCEELEQLKKKHEGKVI